MPEHAGAAVTVGRYDGVHRGHQASIRHLRRLADTLGAPAGVVTVEGDWSGRGRRLTSLDHRLELLARTGIVDWVWVVSSDAMDGRPTESIVRQVLVDHVRPRAVCVPETFRLGTADYATLQRLGDENGFDVVPVDDALEDQSRPDRVCSSARVAELLLEGDVVGAARLLGRPHEMRGVVELGDQRGRTLGFPTANIPIPDTLVIPAEGVYAGYFIGDDAVVRPTAISLGRRPTFYPEGHELLEAHLLDFDGDLYGQPARVLFVHRLRRQRRFASVDQLVQQLHRDIARTRGLLGTPDPREVRPAAQPHSRVATARP
jgi:riboflavin kinase/FMN adenylyltransferase